MKVVEYWHGTIKNCRYDGDVSCSICQSPHEEIMEVDGNAMHDIEKQILHDANDFFFIRVVALDRTQCLRQNAIDSPRHI